MPRMAPESVTNFKFTPKSDVWMYGVMLWEAFNKGAQPYPHLKTEDELREIINAGGDLTPPVGCPDIITEIMLLCWRINPEDRISFAAIIEKLDPVVQNFDAITENLNPVVQPSTSGLQSAPENLEDAD
ncbi:ephrin type-A receptor 4a-like [Planococcus citri]|uniref:ephrin type-A receptor 4a-like n=1 Tax=Planococcus citri TaxID=170843 RepID=UPI0031F96092